MTEENRIQKVLQPCQAKKMEKGFGLSNKKKRGGGTRLGNTWQ